MTLALTTAAATAFHDNRSFGKWLRAKAACTMRQTRQAACMRPSVREIATDRILEIKQGAGMKLECLEGSVWVTLDGDLRDVILEPGQAFTVDRDQRILIQALDSARVRLVQSPHAL
ncbi:MAG: DUF2917 domain-containing protein [Pseudomonadota bacterium]